MKKFILIMKEFKILTYKKINRLDEFRELAAFTVFFT